MNDEGVLEAAALWHARQSSEDMDWLAFETWLSEGACHREAFDAVALLDDEVKHNRDSLRGLLSSPRPMPLEQRLDSRRWRPIAGLVAAGGVAAALLLILTIHEAGPTSGEHLAAETFSAGSGSRAVPLAGGEVILAPGSRLTISRNDPVRAALVGRAVFSVPHDPARTLVVSAEGYEIRDIGTRFEVVGGGGMVEVTVADGEVSFGGGGGGPTARVAAGHAATGFPGGRITTGAATGPVGGWRTGPLLYEAMPLGLVAADIARTTGQAVVADADVAMRPFSGVLARGDREAMVRSLVAMTGLEAGRQGDTIHLGDRTRR